MHNLENPKIFISYAKEDRTIALEIYDFLTLKNFSPWIDEKDLYPGQRWDPKIDSFIEKTDFFIACFSSTSIKKRGYFQKELKKALEVNKTTPEGKDFLIPVRLDNCDIPRNFQQFQYVDWQNETSKKKLLSVISQKPEIEEKDLITNDVNLLLEEKEENEKEAYFKALEIITETIKEDLPSLMIDGLGISTLPPEIFTIQDIDNLDLRTYPKIWLSRISAQANLRKANQFSGFLHQRILMLRRFVNQPKVLSTTQRLAGKVFSPGIGQASSTLGSFLRRRCLICA